MLRDFGILRLVTTGEAADRLSGTGAKQWATTLGKETVKSDAYFKRFHFLGLTIDKCNLAISSPLPLLVPH